MLRYEMPRHPAEIYLLGQDVDNTQVPGCEFLADIREEGLAALAELTMALTAAPVLSGSVTGRALPDHDLLAQNVPCFGAAVQQMSFKITSVGTALHRRYPAGFLSAPTWPLVSDWRPVEIRQLMDGRPELQLQREPFTQGPHKVSYDVAGVSDNEHADYTASISDALAAAGLRALPIFSGGSFLDFVPLGTGKGAAQEHEAKLVTEEFGVTPYQISAGDSMNDCEMLAVADLAIIPSNASDTLKSWAEKNISGTVYFAEQRFASGILEALRHFNIL